MSMINKILTFFSPTRNKDQANLEVGDDRKEDREEFEDIEETNPLPKVRNPESGFPSGENVVDENVIDDIDDGESSGEKESMARQAREGSVSRKASKRKYFEDPFVDPESKTKSSKTLELHIAPVLKRPNLLLINDPKCNLKHPETIAEVPSSNNTNDQSGNLLSKKETTLNSNSPESEDQDHDKTDNSDENSRTEDETDITENSNRKEAHGDSNEDDGDDDDIPLEVLEDMEKLQESFKDLDKKYRLIDKVGEGTFSTVYRAEAINGSVRTRHDLWNSPPIKGRNNRFSETYRKKTKNPIVALKRIYVTSSPQRIHNELMLLYMLEGCERVAPLLDIIRHQDQVIAILPYYAHSNFRDFYRDLPLDGIKLYMFELFSALEFVHGRGIIHRDIKPTNFLYDPFKRSGVLVDFGLAEQQSQEYSSSCPCISGLNTDEVNMTVPRGYPKEDPRPGRRANRAGTRGFRAPEVLFKCTNQSTKIDIWSVGVIFLSLLSKRFPFFNSPDDTDALVELTTIFGIQNMKKCAELHGLGIDSSISPTKGYPFGQIIYWTIHTEKKMETLPMDSPALETLDVLDSSGNIFDDTELGQSYRDALDLLNQCFKLDPKKRITASEALRSNFFKEICDNADDVILD